MNTSRVIVRILTASDGALLQNAAPGAFEVDVDVALSNEFLNDPRHHIAAAVVDGQVVGFASAVHYVHPDKPAQLSINEMKSASPLRLPHTHPPRTRQTRRRSAH